MKQLEFFRHVSIGQYSPSGSRVHALGPGTKYLLLLCLSVVALGSPSPLGALLPLAAGLALGRAAGVRPAFLLRGVAPALPVFGFAALLQFLFAWPGDDSAVLLAAGPLAATAREGWVALNVAARSSSMIVVVGFFTSIASESDIVRGLEDALAPLARLGLPAHRFSLAAATALRFVPIVAGELEAVVKAQSSRGADFGAGRKGPVAKARAYLPLFVPVVTRALERAELLAEAMEARCYTGEGRSRLAAHVPATGDTVVRVLAPLLAAGALALDVLVIAVRIRP